MSTEIRKFGINLLLFSAVLAAVAAGLFATVLKQYYLPVFPFVLLYFMAITFGTFWIISRTKEKQINRFSAGFLGSVGVKLMLSLLFFVIYLIFRRENLLSFSIVFLASYFLFSFFEVRATLQSFRKDAHSKN